MGDIRDEEMEKGGKGDGINGRKRGSTDNENDGNMCNKKE